MINLAHDSAPYTFSLLPGLSVTVSPVDTQAMAIAQAASRRRIDDLEDALNTTLEHGLDVNDMPDLKNPDIKAGLLTAYLIEELADTHIIGWDNVQDEEGNMAELNTANKRALVKLYPLGEMFLTHITATQIQRLHAKED